MLTHNESMTINNKQPPTDFKTILIKTIKSTVNESSKKNVYEALNSAYEKYKYIDDKAADENHMTPLIWAVKLSHLFAIEWLLDGKQHKTFFAWYNPGIGKTDKTGKDEFIYAVSYPDPHLYLSGRSHETESNGKIRRRKCIEYLLYNNSSIIPTISKSYQQCHAIISAAAEHGNLWFIDYFFQNMMPHYPIDKIENIPWDKFLSLASKNNHVEIVKYILEKIFIHVRNNNSIIVTALTEGFLMETSNIESIRLLSNTKISLQNNPYNVNGFECSLIMLPIIHYKNNDKNKFKITEGEFKDIVQMLRKNNNVTFSPYDLFYCAWKGWLDILQFLVNEFSIENLDKITYGSFNFPNCYCMNSGPMTLLMFSIHCQRNEITHYLLDEFEVNPHVQCYANNNSHTPYTALAIAIIEGDIDTIKKLKEIGVKEPLVKSERVYASVCKRNQERVARYFDAINFIENQNIHELKFVLRLMTKNNIDDKNSLIKIFEKTEHIKFLTTTISEVEDYKTTKSSSTDQKNKLDAETPLVNNIQPSAPPIGNSSLLSNNGIFQPADNKKIENITAPPQSISCNNSKNEMKIDEKIPDHSNISLEGISTDTPTSTYSSSSTFFSLSDNISQNILENPLEEIEFVLTQIKTTNSARISNELKLKMLSFFYSLLENIAQQEKATLSKRISQ